MGNYTVTMRGDQIIDKHTHYEVNVSVGPTSGVVMIRGDVIQAFENTYGYSIMKCGRFRVPVDFSENAKRLQECRLVGRSHSTLVGYVNSIEDILVLPK